MMTQAAASHPPPPRPAIPADGPHSQPFRVAAAVLAEMQRRAILPTPHNYDLWFTFRTGGSASLAARLTTLIERGDHFTPALLDALHAEFLGTADSQTVGDAAALQDTADTIVNQVAAGGQAMREYGEALAACKVELNGVATIGSLIQAVANLTAETTKAAERNRMLQQQLSTSAARVARLRQALADTKQEATTDGLTGIANRKAFDAKLRRAILAAAGPESPPLSVLLLDIDHFKSFNDTHGHKAGDLVLRLVGRVLSASVKGRDTAARYGGEEFAIILSGADLRAGTIVGAQIGGALSGKRLANRPAGSGIGQVTLSVGVAQFKLGDTAATLMERADQALYHAKNTGRNRICTERDVLPPIV